MGSDERSALCVQTVRLEGRTKLSAEVASRLKMRLVYPREVRDARTRAPGSDER